MTGSVFSRANDGLAHAALLASMIGLALMTAAIVWQVIGRFVLNDSPSWSEPLALVLMLYFTLLAAAVGVREGTHLGISFLLTRLPQPLARAAIVCGLLLVATFGLLMAIGAVQLMRHTALHTISGLGVSRAVAYLPFALSGALIVLFAIERLWWPVAQPRGAAPT